MCSSDLRLDGHSVRPRSLNVSALPVQIIQKFFAGFLEQRTTGGDFRSKITALYSAGELLTTNLFLRDGSAIVSASACLYASFASTESPKIGISGHSWPPATSEASHAPLRQARKFLRFFLWRQQTGGTRRGQSNLACRAVVALKLV